MGLVRSVVRAQGYLRLHGRRCDYGVMNDGEAFRTEYVLDRPAVWRGDSELDLNISPPFMSVELRRKIQARLAS